MSNLVNLPARRSVGGLMQPREAKALERRLRDLEVETGLKLAAVRMAETVAVTKVEAMEVVGHVGVSAAGSLASRVRFEVERDPGAASAVKLVGEIAVRGVGSQLEDFDRRLRS